MRVTFLGTGDAFSAGGRRHASYLVQWPGGTYLLDCGPTILGSFRQLGLSRGPIDAVVLSHLHVDYFAWLPFLFLEYTYVEPRRRPLRIAGPLGSRTRVMALLEEMYPGTEKELPFELAFTEMLPNQVHYFGPVTVQPFSVPHQEGQSCFGLVLEAAGKKIVYSGDTGWTEELVTRTRSADLFIAECTLFETRMSSHLDYPCLLENRGRFGAKRMILTHIGQEVLARIADVHMEVAYDGLTIDC